MLYLDFLGGCRERTIKYRGEGGDFHISSPFEDINRGEESENLCLLGGSPDLGGDWRSPKRRFHPDDRQVHVRRKAVHTILTMN